MDKFKLLKLYLSPIEEMIKLRFSLEETKSFEARVNDFHQQNSSMEPSMYKQELIREFGIEVESARYYANKVKMNRILNNILFFFWVTLFGMIAAIIGLIASAE